MQIWVIDGIYFQCSQSATLMTVDTNMMLDVMDRSAE